MQNYKKYLKCNEICKGNMPEIFVHLAELA